MLSKSWKHHQSVKFSSILQATEPPEDWRESGICQDS